MNHIQSKQKKLEIYRAGIEYLKQYLGSSKFQGEGNNYVNVSDIFLRLGEMESELNAVD